ncbi:MAG: hypothetical protein R3Y29_00650 [bacterium]
MNINKKLTKSILVIALQIVVITSLLTVAKFMRDGVPLFGIPSEEDVQRITISYPALTDDLKEITSPDEILYGVKLTNLLKYELFKEADPLDNLLVEITYYLKNNKQVQVYANNSTVWWKDKAYKIKEAELFIYAVESGFFLQEFNANN